VKESDHRTHTDISTFIGADNGAFTAVTRHLLIVEGVRAYADECLFTQSNGVPFRASAVIVEASGLGKHMGFASPFLWRETVQKTSNFGLISCEGDSERNSPSNIRQRDK
jgi:hypothetical protein